MPGLSQERYIAPILSVESEAPLGIAGLKQALQEQREEKKAESQKPIAEDAFTRVQVRRGWADL